MKPLSALLEGEGAFLAEILFYGFFDCLQVWKYCFTCKIRTIEKPDLYKKALD